jgi:hypothetical protein
MTLKGDTPRFALPLLFWQHHSVFDVKLILKDNIQYQNQSISLSEIKEKNVQSTEKISS